jgi:superfamily I DNA/RNA helicase
MHSAKGLDFRHVYLVGLTTDGLPGRRVDDSTTDDESTATQEMQRRLLYTAMVRAVRHPGDDLGARSGASAAQRPSA